MALAFANQAAVAMENARLYQESVTRVEQELDEVQRQGKAQVRPGGASGGQADRTGEG